MWCSLLPMIQPTLRTVTDSLTSPEILRKKQVISSKDKTKGNNLQEHQTPWWWDQGRRCRGYWAKARHGTARLGDLPPPPPPQPLTTTEPGWEGDRKNLMVLMGCDRHGLGEKKSIKALGKPLSQDWVWGISQQEEFLSHNYLKKQEW